MLNPLTQPIEELRRIFLLGAPPQLIAILCQLVASLVVLLAALRCFRWLKEDFADVL